MKGYILFDTDRGIEKITLLVDGLENTLECSRLVDVLAPEISALNDALVMRSSAVSSRTKLKKTALVV